MSFQFSSTFLSLRAEQIRLEEALRTRSPLLADMYVSALLVLQDQRVPCRIPQAAHAIRELMEKLPEVVAVPATEERISLKQQVHELRAAWIPVGERVSDLLLSAERLELDGVTRRFFTRARQFFEDFARDHPTRQKMIVSLLERLEVSGTPVAVPLSDKNARHWMSLKDYFNKVAHHRGGDHEFVERLRSFEDFLHPRLAPVTFNDFDEIDKILFGGPDAE